MSIKLLESILRCALFAVLIGLGVRVYLAVGEAGARIDRSLAVFDAQIVAVDAQVRRLVRQIDTQATVLQKQVADERRTLNEQVERAVSLLDRRTFEASEMLALRSGDLTREVAGLRADLRPALEHSGDAAAKLDAALPALLAPVTNIAQVASENADLLGRCLTQDPDTGEFIGNPDCFANRAIPAMKSLERMADSGQKMFHAIEQETPESAQALRQTSQNLSTITERITKPAGWIKGLFMGIAKTVGSIFL